MPSLTIHPPRQPNDNSAASPSSEADRQYTKPAATSSNGGSQSPVAPAFSPITPKPLPALPATYPPPSQHAASPGVNTQPDTATQRPQSEAIAPASQLNTQQQPQAQFIPQPPSQPFSSEDSTDAIALRAAISSLQFQKKKAQDDVRTLERIRKQALGDPASFKRELAAGRLKEERLTVGDVRAVLDQEDSDDDDDEGHEAILGAQDERVEADAQKPAEVPDSQPSRPTTSSGAAQSEPLAEFQPSFDRIPGPQNVVRMPPINWDKYHITGDVLDQMHEQQRRWPGSEFTFTPSERTLGREHAVAAPYSPWLDSLDGQGQQADVRKDSLATPTAMDPGTPAQTPTAARGSISEHIMETRGKGQ